MSNCAHGTPGRRIKDARGFKVKAFDTLHNETWWYSKTYSSLRNIKLAIAQRGFNEWRFWVKSNDNEWRPGIVELYIYDVETWKLAAVRRGNGGTDIIMPDDCSKRRAGEWEDKVRAQEEQEDE